jgi:hypothetical protein
MKGRTLSVGIAAVVAMLGFTPQAASAAPAAGNSAAEYEQPLFGTIDAIEPTAEGRIRVSGWAIDPNTSLSTYVDIQVDGRFAGTFFANVNRPDVGRAFPQFGSNHGYETTVEAGDGRHSVCVSAKNPGDPDSVVGLGCRDVTLSNQPFGALDVVERTGPAIRAGGWVIDPNTTLPISVHTYVDGVFAGATNADEYRSDIASIYPQFGGYHAYNAVVPASVGTHSVCVYAINVGAGSNIQLGCKTVTISDEPSGALDVSEHSGSTILTAGWVIDPNTTSPIDVHLYIDGAFVTAVRADASRPDLLRFYPSFGPNHGYLISVPDRPGNHTVCVYAINVGPGPGNPLIGCKNI